MTLNSLLNTIALIGIDDKLVNWAGGGTSVYQAANALTIKDYPFLFASPTGTHRAEENWTTYTITLFYVSRLLEDNSNELDIQSTAVEVIKNIVKKIQNTDGVISVSNEYTINVFVEYEKFSDRCTGAFATLEISIVNDTTCTVDETHYFVFDNLPGEMLPADSNKYYISWRTDYPAINYTFILPNGEIVNGYTEEKHITVEFPENTDRADKTFTFIAYADGEVGRLEWYQRSIEFFEFVTEDNQVLRADTTGFTVIWATNIEGETEYVVTKNGVETETGTTAGDNVTVYMEMNGYRDYEQEYSVSVSIGGVYMGTLQWKQDKPIFNVLAGGNAVLPAEATAATVTWETTYPWVGWRLHSYVTGEDLDEGTTSGTTITVSFPENTDTENQSYYTVAFWNPNGEPLNLQAEIRQDPAGQVYYFNFITESGQTVSASTTAFTAEWEMNYPDPFVQYRLYDGNEMIVLGNTTGTTATVTFPENYNNERKQYVFEAWNYNGCFRYGQLVFYQEALPLPVYFFRITSEDEQTVPANATAFTINYETNIQPPFRYAYTSPFGVYEGYSWNQSALTITFSENDKTEVQERMVEIGGERITWYQAAAAYEFEFINTEGITVPAATTAYTVEWRTNLDSIGYKFYSGNILVTSGDTSATAMTVTFEENVSTSRTNTLRFIAYAGNTELDTLHWTQAVKIEDEYLNTGITSNLVIGPEVMEAADIIPYGYYGLKWEAGEQWFVNGRTGTDHNYENRYYVFGDMHVENGIVPLPYSQKIRVFQAIPVADIPELSGSTLYYYNASGSSIWDKAIVYTGAAYCMRDMLSGKYLRWADAGFTRWTTDPAESVFFDRMCANLQPDGNGIKACICPANVVSQWVHLPQIGNIYGFENVLIGDIRYGDPAYPPSGFATYAEWNEVRCGWHKLTPVE